MRLSSLPNYLAAYLRIRDIFPNITKYYDHLKEELTNQMCFENTFGYIYVCWLLFDLRASISNQMIMIPRGDGGKVVLWIDQHQISTPSIALKLFGLGDLLCWLLGAQNWLCKLHNTKHLSQQAFIDSGVLQTLLPSDKCSWYIWYSNNTEINISGK